jgi:hypothetical protein
LVEELTCRVSINFEHGEAFLFWAANTSGTPPVRLRYHFWRQRQ